MTEGNRILKEQSECESFCNGIAVGVNLCQQAVLAAHDRKEFFKIGNDLYYIQSSRERLEQMLDEICR